MNQFKTAKFVPSKTHFPAESLIFINYFFGPIFDIQKLSNNKTFFGLCVAVALAQIIFYFFPIYY